MELIDIFEFGSLDWAICTIMLDISQEIINILELEAKYSSKNVWIKYGFKITGDSVYSDAEVVNVSVDEEKKLVTFSLSKDLNIFSEIKIAMIQDSVIEIINQDEGFILGIGYDMIFQGRGLERIVRNI